MEALVASVLFMILFSEYKAGCCPLLFGARFYKKVTNKTIYRTNFVEKRNRFYSLIMFFFTKSVFLKLFLYYDQTAIINRNYKFHSIRKKIKGIWLYLFTWFLKFLSTSSKLNSVRIVSIARKPKPTFPVIVI